MGCKIGAKAVIKTFRPKPQASVSSPGSPIGGIKVLTAAGQASAPYVGQNLYAERLRQFKAAGTGQGVLAATGHDGLASLAEFEAVREAAQSDTRVAVNYGRHYG